MKLSQFVLLHLENFVGQLTRKSVRALQVNKESIFMGQFLHFHHIAKHSQHTLSYLGGCNFKIFVC